MPGMLFAKLLLVFLLAARADKRALVAEDQKQEGAEKGSKMAVRHHATAAVESRLIARTQ